MSGEPHPKSSQLARGPQRTSCRRATKQEWAAIAKAKQGPCRVCVRPGSNGSYWRKIELHHLVPRSWGGDDTEDNIVPLCLYCHARVTAYEPDGVLAALAASLTDAEYVYCSGKLGEGAMERLFGVGRRG